MAYGNFSLVDKSRVVVINIKVMTNFAPVKTAAAKTLKDRKVEAGWLQNLLLEPQRNAEETLLSTRIVLSLPATSSKRSKSLSCLLLKQCACLSILHLIGNCTKASSSSIRGKRESECPSSQDRFLHLALIFSCILFCIRPFSSLGGCYTAGCKLQTAKRLSLNIIALLSLAVTIVL